MKVWNYDKTLKKARAGELNTDEWRLVRRKARERDTGACYILSLSKVTNRTRRRWLKIAADLGHARAFYELYDAYPTANTDGWLLKEAETGCHYAQSALGCHYAWVPDHVNMRYWYLQAARQGNANAQYETGFAMLLGEGGDKDVPQALEWLEKAAPEIDEARRLLCDLYEGGLYDVPQSPERAEYWRNQQSRDSWP